MPRNRQTRPRIEASTRQSFGALRLERMLPKWPAILQVSYRSVKPTLRLIHNQHNSDPQIGEFSITFTQAGGIDGNTEDGLHHPILQIKNFNNWEKFDVQAFIDDEESQPHGKLCKKGYDWNGRAITWTCGIPQIGQALYGLSNYNPPSDQPGYTPGWCTMHVVQHQRNEYGVGADYAFDVVIFDHVSHFSVCGKTTQLHAPFLNSH